MPSKKNIYTNYTNFLKLWFLIFKLTFFFITSIVRVINIFISFKRIFSYFMRTQRKFFTSLCIIVCNHGLIIFNK